MRQTTLFLVLLGAAIPVSAQTTAGPSIDDTTNDAPEEVAPAAPANTTAPSTSPTGTVATKDSAERKFGPDVGKGLGENWSPPNSPDWSSVKLLRFLVIDHPEQAKNQTGWIMCALLLDVEKRTAWAKNLDEMRTNMGLKLDVAVDRILFVAFKDLPNSAFGVDVNDTTANTQNTWFEFSVSSPEYQAAPGEEKQSDFEPIPPKADDDDDSFPVWAIIVTVVGGVLVVGLLAFMMLKKKTVRMPLGQQIQELQSIYEEEERSKAIGGNVGGQGL
eukprot:Hpha_TRINITY_DN15087_c0_g1::TRINITY_DN15087_c0_g1_i1::g.123991::m.123991